MSVSIADLSKIMRHCGRTDVFSGDAIMTHLNGNPLVCIMASYMLSVVSVLEAAQIVDLARKKDREQIGLGSTGPDVWLDGSRIWTTPDGKPYGTALCLRAWVRMLLGHLETHHKRAYDLVRMLKYAPSGLHHLEALVIVPEAEMILQTVVDQ